MPRKGFFLLALICGLIAAGSIYIYLKGEAQVTATAATELRPLVVAKADIPDRTVIDAAQLSLTEVPIQGYPKGGFSSVQSVVGSVALLNLAAGDSVLSSMVQQLAAESEGTNAAKNTAGGSPSLAVPQGKRAVSIPIDLVSGVSYLVKPGDHVDVLTTIDVKQGTDTVPVTALAAQDALVLNVGDSSGTDKSSSNVEAKSYTLALSVPQAMAVTQASAKGTIRLLLRNPADQEIQHQAPVSSSQFADTNSLIYQYK